VLTSLTVTNPAGLEATMEKKDRAARTKPASEPPQRRKLNLDKESIKDLAPSARAGSQVKGGIPRLTNSGGGGQPTGN
jgi:hypothetical protein